MSKRSVRFQWTWPKGYLLGRAKERIRSSFYRRMAKAPHAYELSFMVNTSPSKGSTGGKQWWWCRCRIDKQYPSKVWPVKVDFT